MGVSSGGHDDEQQYLLNRLQEEVDELANDIYSGSLGNPSVTDTKGECCDVGDFAMMIHTADLPDEKIKPMIAEKIESLRAQQGKQENNNRNEE